jgi:hypothetical protein
MSKFKVGQRVTVVKTHGAVQVGQKGTVVSGPLTDGVCYVVFDLGTPINGMGNWCMMEDYLEITSSIDLAKNAKAWPSKFCKGDTVQVVRRTAADCHAGLSINSRGEVLDATNISSNGSPRVQVAFKSSYGGEDNPVLWVDEDRLTLHKKGLTEEQQHKVKRQAEREAYEAQLRAEEEAAKPKLLPLGHARNNQRYQTAQRLLTAEIQSDSQLNRQHTSARVERAYKLADELLKQGGFENHNPTHN